MMLSRTLLGGFLRGMAAGLVCLTLTCALVAAGPDWPQFRGANRDDISPDTGLLKEWPKDGPPVLWKAAGIGSGYAGVSVVGDKIFTMGDRGGECQVFALDQASGKLLWTAKLGRGEGGGGYPGPRCTPTVDGALVYALSQRGDLVCLEAASGAEKWRKNLITDFKGSHGNWGYAESPLIDGDHLVCTPGGSSATMVALNKKTGETVWKASSPGEGNAGYASIVIAEVGGVRQYVQLVGGRPSSTGGVLGVAAKDGRLLWKYDKFGPNTANIPTCIVQKDLVFCCAGYGKGGALLQLAPSSDGGIACKELYFNRELANKHGGVVLVNGHLYGDRDDSGYPFCADFMTGKVSPGWVRSAISTGGKRSASVSYADGHLYVRYQSGHMALVEATPAGYKEKSSFQIPSTRGPSWPHPVIIGGKLYLRDHDTLWCHDVKQK